MEALVSESIRIDPRFCGPKASGNGGYVSGRLATFVDGAAKVSLRSPPPLAKEIRIERDGVRIAAYDGETLVGTAEPGEVSVRMPEVPSPGQVEAARVAYERDLDKHYLPYCFVCGPRRAAGDGLRLCPGPAGATPVNATHWIPDISLADTDGLVRPEFLWAALDCPSAFALRKLDMVCLLGAMTGEVRRRPSVGERLVVMAWADRFDGRKHLAESAVVDEIGEAIAVANTLWIELTDPAVIRKLKTENA